jgi:DNA-binding CsgD family transcriptional regulator
MAQPPTLTGRARECDAIDRLLGVVRRGESRTLVIRGEPGIGKTALLEYAVASASDLRVVRAAGVESEMELAFAGLHQLCVPLLGHLEQLPGPQRAALSTAFGLDTGRAPDRFLIGLAVLGLVAEAGGDRALLCVVDNAQSLDRASMQTLAFVGRRLHAESVGMLFATTERATELHGLTEVELGGLRNDDARALLAAAITGPLDERIRDRIVAESRGNPLALLELPRRLAPAELAGGYRLPGAVAVSGRIEESFRRRFDDLPSDTRRLSLLAAAEPVGEAALVWRAAADVGIGPEAAEPAATEGLLEFGTRVRFRHPLVRAVVYRAATQLDRQSAHRALAEATDPQRDPDRRAWHRAQGAAGPDEEIAGELERSAGRAQARGGLAAAAAFLEKAAELTPDPARRAQRGLGAADAKHRAGAPEDALALLGRAEAGQLDDLERAMAWRLRGQIAFASRRGNDAPPLLLEAASRLEALDLRLARDTYLEALAAGLYAGRLATRAGVLEAAHAARSVSAPAGVPRPADLLLDGLSQIITDGYTAGAPILRSAVAAFQNESIALDDELRWLWLACHAAIVTWDYESWDALSARQLELCREAGALTVLPIALSSRIGVHLNVGDLAAARSLVQELEEITAAAGTQLPPYGVVALAGWEGSEDRARRLIQSSSEEVAARGEGMGLTVIEWVTAVLYNGLDRPAAALTPASSANEHPEELWSTLWLHELVEAAARSGDAERAREAFARLAAMTQVSATDWALGVEARSRALVTDGPAAEDHFCEAIERLGRTRLGVALGRARLLYGEWLAGASRRAEAREQLRLARETFSSLGVEAYASRADRALHAAGERLRPRPAAREPRLTSREAEIARLARDGFTNPQIGARLFLSPRTVEYHLHKVFGKLGVSSRNELDVAL